MATPDDRFWTALVVETGAISDHNKSWLVGLIAELRAGLAAERIKKQPTERAKAPKPLSRELARLRAGHAAIAAASDGKRGGRPRGALSPFLTACVDHHLHELGCSGISADKHLRATLAERGLLDERLREPTSADVAEAMARAIRSIEAAGTYPDEESLLLSAPLGRFNWPRHAFLQILIHNWGRNRLPEAKGDPLAPGRGPFWRAARLILAEAGYLGDADTLDGAIKVLRDQAGSF